MDVIPAPFLIILLQKLQCWRVTTVDLEAPSNSRHGHMIRRLEEEHIGARKRIGIYQDLHVGLGRTTTAAGAGAAADDLWRGSNDSDVSPVVVAAAAGSTAGFCGTEVWEVLDGFVDEVGFEEGEELGGPFEGCFGGDGEDV